MEAKKVGGAMQELKDKALEFVKLNGPLLPVKIAKAIGKDITFAGALLSELVANKKVKVSIAKIGGSPVYYTPGQEARLQTLEPYLHGREKDAYKLLKEKRLIWEGDAEPWQRVALRDLKDFAIPINVIAEDGSNMSFWKWYLASEDDIKPSISRYLEPQKGSLEKTHEKIIIQENTEIVRQDAKQTRQEILQDFITPVEIKKTTEYFDKPEVKVKQSKRGKLTSPIELENYLNKKQIEILSKEIGKKGKEVDMIAYVPSGLGKIKFFIAYRNKKKIGEADISMIFSRSQVKNIPAILLSTGELTKKAKEYLEKDFRSVTFHKV